MKDVHTEHCCIMHGCKYGSKDCTVMKRLGKQSYPCEDCQEEKAYDIRYSLGQLLMLLRNLKIYSSDEVNVQEIGNYCRMASYEGPYRYEEH